MPVFGLYWMHISSIMGTDIIKGVEIEVPDKTGGNRVVCYALGEKRTFKSQNQDFKLTIARIDVLRHPAYVEVRVHVIDEQTQTLKQWFSHTGTRCTLSYDVMEPTA